jgi:hypothetical protein
LIWQDAADKIRPSQWLKGAHPEHIHFCKKNNFIIKKKKKIPPQIIF